MKTFKFLIFSLLASSYLAADSSTILIDVKSYGYLDQYSLNTSHGFIGDEACVPSASVNAMTFLQNSVPNIFGTTLTGTTYSDWEATADVLINIMGTQPNSGTSFYRLPYGLKKYISQMKGYTQVQFSGRFPYSAWAPGQGYPKPNYITSGKPDLSSLATSLAARSAVLLSIVYLNGNGGHEILANGLTWDPITQTGTLYFIDSLDPSERYSATTVEGPTLQSLGTLSIRNGQLILEYNQYAGTLPYTNSYARFGASIYALLSVGGGFGPNYVTLDSENSSHIAQGFLTLDPTTQEMFPILAVLNTLSPVELNTALEQEDPSIFASVLFAEHSSMRQVQQTLTNSLLQYRNCFCPCNCLRLWAVPYVAKLRQDGKNRSYQRFNDEIQGFTAGGDYLFNHNFLGGTGFAYTNNQLHWPGVYAKAEIQSYEAFLYGAWLCSPFWVDASFGYAYNKVHARRDVNIAASFPYIAPINNKIKHSNQSKSLLGHLGFSYDCIIATCFDCRGCLWPFGNFDYIYANHPSFEEKGGGILNLHVNHQHANFIRSELGLAWSLYRNTYQYLSFAHFMLSYVNEAQCNGKKTTAFFVDNPESAFTVSNLIPDHNFVCPSIVIGFKDPCDLFCLDFIYHGAFGVHFSSNELMAQLSICF